MDLNRVATFVQVVDAGTFTAAAKRLGLPTSSVSRGVSKLERELGIVLLERTTRQISLTDAGRAYYERAREAIAGLEQATELASETLREPSGIVRLAAPPDMAAKLVHTVGAFVRQYPNIHVDVVTTARGAEIVGGEVDVALVLGPLEDSALIVRRLGRSTHRLYAAPAYLEARGRPRSVADLARHDAVLYRANSGKLVWELVGPRGAQKIEVSGPISGDNYQLVVDAVVAGHGIGLVPEMCVAHGAADSDALVPVLPKLASVGAVQSLVHPSRHLPKRVRLFRDFLADHLLTGCRCG